MGRHALILGTATYHADRKLTPLPGVRQDVEQLQTLLETDGEFDSVTARIDLPAVQMKQLVEEFYGARLAGDLALFYYSGHGVLHGDRQSLFLGTIDTDTSILHTTAFDVEGILRHMLNDTKAGQKVVLLDCCFSGSFTARHRFTGGVRQEPRRLKRERGTFLLQSSSHLKASKAQGPDRPSLFTEVLLTGLRGAAQGTAEDGWITASDLSRYAMTEMSRRRREEKPVESSEGVTEPIPLVSGSVERRRHVPGKPAEEPDDAPFDTERWRRLLGYYVNCLQRSAVLQFFVDPVAGDSYVPAPAGREVVFSASEPVRFGERGQQLAKAAEAGGRSLQYGYPVVTLSPKGRQQLHWAPLLVCDLTVGADGLAHPAPPQPSPALVDHFQLSVVEADELREAVAERLVPGDRRSLADAVNLVAKAFGLKPASPLDPQNLAGRVDRGPLNRVQNAGMLFAAGSTESPDRQLIEDLQEIVKNAGKIASTALGALSNANDDPRVEPAADVLTVAPSSVNETQEEIIRAAMSRPLTVAQGPPGTGKSQLVTALLATATAAGQSVLIGSTNNRAVDEVVERVTAMVGSGLILRTGNKDYRQQEPQYLAEVMQAWPPPAADTRGPFHELRLVAHEIEQLREELDHHRRLERDLADLAFARDATLTDTDERTLAKLVDLTERALRSRWFGWWYRRRLRSSGAFDRDAITVLGESAVIEQCWRERQRQLVALPHAVEDAWQRLRTLQHDTRAEHSKELLRAQIATRVSGNTTLLRNRADEMAKPNGSSWTYMSALVKALPGWAVTAKSARRLQPRAGLFDLVIIDEAAQCTVADILPMLYRAERALIIGDPRQLTPVVELSADDDRREQARAGLGHGWLTNRRLTYRDHSAYEAFAAAAGSTILLDEHYRCHPEIIDAPNRVVYQNRLTVLTDPGRLAAPAEPATRWVDVPGHFTKGATGSGRNADEIQAVVTEVQRVRKEYPEASIGVVTPLAEQQRHLQRALLDQGLTDNLLCATIHKFQGSEKDIMVVSPVGAQGISERTRGWLVNQTNLWNVAITRARSQLIVAGDRSWWSGQRGLLADLASPTRTTAAGTDVGPRPADRLIAGLRETGLTVHWETPLPGYPVDFTISLGDKRLAVLVDDPDGDPDGHSLRRVLSRLDIIASAATVKRVPAWRCLAEPEQVVAELRDAIGTDLH
ncbi:peptidase C14 [Actinoplanes sp. SE50]|uniref:AAA domain-containing protein n=1 Tax=unclassified Actinoplanes TaxID=2626549 RepID=UPI00023ED14B|nr:MULTISPECIES: AAA domain-containing protein [unclassified Actinoplanes]AEV87818.1 putative ATP-dependent helicase [Actinoplanes sp. SE50/110]ATO86220.1 peptidase C14 [Actinoplanes sp. SE50]SLM03634.1 peptidase C14 [Actinoplanes sp. SE50/110]